MKKMNFTVDQVAFIKANYMNKTTRWIAEQLNLGHSTVAQKIRCLKSSKESPENKLINMRQNLSDMQKELLVLKGSEWDEMVRKINNLSVDIELKRRQKQFKNSTTSFGDEKPVYKTNNL